MEYTVLNPRGLRSRLDIVPLTQRLPSLDGKVVYCVEQNRPVFMEELSKRLIKYIPEAKFVFKLKPGGFQSDDMELRDEIVQKADAMIYGTAMGGGSGMFGTGWTIEVEKQGVPSVYIVGEPFLPDIKVSAEMRGMPLLRTVPIHLVDEVRVTEDITDEQYLEIISKIVETLTKPLTEEEKKTDEIVPEKPPRIAMTGTLAEVQDYFYEQRWTDGLPIIPPTKEKVAEFLNHTKHSPDEIVTTTMWPEELEATVEKVAVVGVMAGCKPQYMPVLLAIVEAWGKGNFNLLVRSGSSASPVIIVNGPIRNEIGMNKEQNAMGPCNQANAAIGRFLRLAVVNLGGLWPGVNDMSAQGSPIKYGFCFPENEEKSPWEPLHVSMGYKPDESVISILISGWSHQNLFGAGESLDFILEKIAKAIVSFQGRNGAVIAMAPGMAQFCSANDMSKENVEQYICEHAVASVSELRTGFFRGSRTDDSALPDDALVQVCPCESLKVVVVGGETGMPIAQTWQFQSPSMASVDNWR